MAVARFASAKPAAGVAQFLHTIERTALTSIVAVNISGFTKISAWIVLAGALSKTATGTAGSKQIVVNNNTSLTVGMLISGEGIPSKTLVTGINGTTLELSLPLTANLSTTAVSIGDWIPYVDNIELTNRNTFETFRIAVNVGDKIYASSDSGEVVFFINGIYDISGRANVTVGAQPPEPGSEQIGDVWINESADPRQIQYWNGSDWIDIGTIGPEGPANDLTIGTVETADFGDPAQVTITGDSPEQVLNFVLPQGDQGPANILTVGTVTASAPGEDAEVEITGESPDQTINFVLPRGETGPQGPDGLPDQEDNEGKYLTTDGTAAFWETVDALPEQTGNEGKYLTTDGTDPEWAFLSGGSAATEPPTVGLVDGSIWLDTDGDVQAPSGRLIRWVKTATAGQTSFSGVSDGTGITLNYNPSSEQVFLNGVQLVRGSDYTGSDGIEIVLVDPASAGDILQVITLPFVIAGSNLLTEESFTAKGDILTAIDSGQSVALDLGTAGQILTVNTSTSTGLEWKTVSATAPVTYDSTTQTLGVSQSFINQTVQVFASAAARNTAIPSPTEGMVVYLNDTNLLETYNNSAWVPVGNAGTPSYNFVQTLYYTSSGTFTKATYPWLRAIRVKVQGGGGGGGGTNVTPTEALAAANGGGGGTYGERFITDISSLPSSVTVTVGAGGAAGVGATQTGGGTGGTSSFHNMSATGGFGAGHGFPFGSAFAVPFGTEGGYGGANLDVYFPGKNSGPGLGINYSRLTFQGSSIGGNGGDSYLGRGGRSGNGAAGGVNAGVLGGGGGGRNQGNDGGTGSANGAAGGDGIVIVELYS